MSEQQAPYEEQPIHDLSDEILTDLIKRARLHAANLSAIGHPDAALGAGFARDIEGIGVDLLTLRGKSGMIPEKPASAPGGRQIRLMGRTGIIS